MTRSVFPVAGWRGRVTTHWDTGLRGGTDIFANVGTPVLAVIDGVVDTVTTEPPDRMGGNTVYIVSSVTVGGRAREMHHYYAHLNRAPSVAAGQRVTAGQQIGTVGKSGNAAATNPHLHFGMGYGLFSDRSGARSGVGMDFDAVTFLQNILDGTGAGFEPGTGTPGNVGGVIGEVASGATQALGSALGILAGLLRMITAVITSVARLVRG